MVLISHFPIPAIDYVQDLKMFNFFPPHLIQSQHYLDTNTGARQHTQYFGDSIFSDTEEPMHTSPPSPSYEGQGTITPSHLGIILPQSEGHSSAGTRDRNDVISMEQVGLLDMHPRKCLKSFDEHDWSSDDEDISTSPKTSLQVRNDQIDLLKEHFILLSLPYVPAIRDPLYVIIILYTLAVVSQLINQIRCNLVLKDLPISL